MPVLLGAGADEPGFEEALGGAAGPLLGFVSMSHDRGGYRGTAEVVFGGDSLGTYPVALDGYVNAVGRRVWKGEVSGLTADRLEALAGQVATVRTVDGRVGQAVFPFARGLILGTGEPPFDM